MDALFDLSGRVAIVTGAGSGIGRATAVVLAGLGASLVVTDVDQVTARETVASLNKGTHIALRHDVTIESDWDTVAQVVDGQYGRLDVLVNNAGIMLARGFLEAGIEDLRRQQRINVEGPWFGMQMAIPRMLRTAATHATSPSIINVSSVYGQVAGDRYAAYSASKGAIAMLSRAVAAEFAGRGLRINSVHPGPCATNLGAQHEPMRDGDGVPLAAEAVMRYWLARMPVGRMGQAGDIAPVIAFLAGDAARFVTGAQIVADGGYTAV